MDYNCYNLLIRASVEEVAKAMAEDAENWEQDVLSRAIIVQSKSLFIFRLKGHDWSVVVESPIVFGGFGRVGNGGEKALSRRLHTDLIVFATSDTCGSIGYVLIEDGEVIEEFYGEDDEDDGGNSVVNLETCQFVSTRRDLKTSQIGNPYSFVESFLDEEGAFDPGIEFGYFFDHKPASGGESRTVENPGFECVYPSGVVRDTPEIERIDYLVLKSP